MLKRLTNNWALKLTALILSVVLWSHVRGQVNPWETASFKVRLDVDTPRGYVLQDGEQVPRSVTVALRAPRLTLRQLKGGAPANPLAASDEVTALSTKQLCAYLDFNAPKPGLQNVAVKVENGLEDVEVIGAKPLEIPLVLDVAAKRKVKVDVRFDLPRDWRATNVRPGTPVVEVAGASQVLERVINVRAQVRHSFSATGAISIERVALTAVDQNGREVEGVTVEPDHTRIRATIAERVEEKSVPVKTKTTGAPASGYTLDEVNVTPTTVRVRGPRRVLRDLDSLTATLDISGARRNRTRTVALKAPAGVEFTASGRVSVQARLSAQPAPTPLIPPVRHQIKPAPTPRAPVPARPVPMPAPATP